MVQWTGLGSLYLSERGDVPKMCGGSNAVKIVGISELFKAIKP